MGAALDIPRGRSVYFYFQRATLAQLVEQSIRNRQVWSSSLQGGSINFKLPYSCEAVIRQFHLRLNLRPATSCNRTAESCASGGGWRTARGTSPPPPESSSSPMSCAPSR